MYLACSLDIQQSHHRKVGPLGLTTSAPSSRTLAASPKSQPTNPSARFRHLCFSNHLRRCHHSITFSQLQHYHPPYSLSYYTPTSYQFSTSDFSSPRHCQHPIDPQSATLILSPPVLFPQCSDLLHSALARLHHPDRRSPAASTSLSLKFTRIRSQCVQKSSKSSPTRSLSSCWHTNSPRP
jgi:hypothetical protein